ncbi:hypothetical protein DICPUDRAFT_149310 [Dictyostelium purpureum]|uniref:BRO1 domain-containing protein n=1 Tax=Dictyostelium purpureum TaxID=5786 RepID=F0ZDD1_DICPU|nr:uncharacterized protein DICPUDRAFT_149310 [Dictyostelium purpureum]EGC38045.1 hypothetical protein DICPUDRAFT_149310 [Dictyostelium purpureum]|eukprot:XP_003285446.1 hypothetical protein DICPUDRAFT_149310 [Dictyostelium purpureum]
MLSVERKRTEKIDLIKPLTKYIKEQFSKGEADAHENQINTLNSLREDVRNLQDKTETSKELVWRYYSILSSLELRFPISENNVRISFPWTDSFRQKRTTLYSIYFERASVLFNYGSIISQIGASINRSNIEGIKKACNYFQISAGVFLSLREYVSLHPECSASPDFTSEALNTLHTIMLAQAQECIFEKASMDNLSDAIVSKLAAQVSEYYEASNHALNSNTLKSIVDRNWTNTVLVKSFLYKAIASYIYSKGLGASSQFGEQVSRLIIAIDNINQAKANLQKSAQPELREIVEKYAVSILKYYESAKKDNETIYHDTVLPAHKLTPIEKKPLAKALPLPEISFVDPFSSLVPFSVKEDSAYYNDQKEQLLRKELDNIEFHNQSARASLLSMGLPGSIEALEVGVPKALQEKMDILRNEQASNHIVQLLENIQQLSDEDSSILTTASNLLKKEEDEDNEMRAQYGSAWHRTPSYTLTASLIQDLAKYSSHIQHSTKSDSFIRKKYEDNKNLISDMENQQEIIALLPSNSFPASKVSVASLTVLLNDLDSLMANRESIAEKLKTQCKKDDITLKLISPSKDKSLIYAEEILKYEPLQMALNESFLKQKNLIEEIRKENEKFTSSKSKQGNQREEILQRYANAFKVYNELKSNLDEGTKFYLDFQEILNKFKRRCEDFTKEREKERIELVRQISAGVNPYSPVTSPQNPLVPPHGNAYPQYSTPPNYQSPPPQYNYNAVPPPYQPQSQYTYTGAPQSFNAPPPPQSFSAPPPPQSFSAPPPPQSFNAPPPPYKPFYK